MVAAECGASIVGPVADGRCKRTAVVTRGDHPGFGIGLHPTSQAPFLARYPDCSDSLLADWTGGLDIYHRSCVTTGMETSVVGGMVLGGAVDGVCLVVAAMAIAAGDDRSELLSYPANLSPMERLRQGYV